MIHQFIFASPKPGLTEREFQDYWKYKHAVQFASKIPQIKQYSICSRIAQPTDTGDPLCGGVAEIWLENETEQLASLQSPEFIEGARKDEPNWAAFWRSFALDTDPHVLIEGPGQQNNSSAVKLFVLLKRKEGMPLDEFRSYWKEVHGPMVEGLPGIRRYGQYAVRDGAYAVGESLFDGVATLWFDDLSAAQKALGTPELKALVEDTKSFVNQRYIHSFLTDEYWVMGPHGYA
ncbi:MAG: EthD family reductase [Chloroflexota bacterium]